NRLPHEAVAAGRLREDLLYRLNVFPLDLPPLRERLSDLGLLASHFLADIGTQEGRPRSFTPAALAQLARYHWPGNVRELRNAVQRAYVMAQGDTIDDTWLPRGEAGLPVAEAPAVAASAAPAVPQRPVVAQVPAAAEAVVLPIGTSVAQAERLLTLATLRHFNHHTERTAAVLGISLKTLYNRLKEYAADSPEADEIA
ncbi:MAG: helix-turn-helix domain-containing protein, partial [Rubrivivax sp.]|nr:helix-turn-helix domain-containing protein [Rubrivivax sp.]